MENLKSLDFLAKLAKDTKLAEKFFSYTNIEEMHKFALAHSDEKFTQEELEDTLINVIELTEKIQSGELSKEKLVKIAGGKESNFRTVAMLASPIANLLLGLPNAVYGWHTLIADIQAARARKKNPNLAGMTNLTKQQHEDMAAEIIRQMEVKAANEAKLAAMQLPTI